MMHFSKILCCVTLLFATKANAQDTWRKITVKGTVTYTSVTTTKNLDADGEVTEINEHEETFSSDQIFTFFVDRFTVLAGNEKKLKEYFEANANALLVGDNFQEQNPGGTINSFPVRYSSRSKSRGICYNEDNRALRLMSTSDVAEELVIHGSRTSLRMIPVRSQQHVDDDKMMAKAMDKFAKMIMAEKKARDIKAGKKINEADYFVPANLYHSDIYGLYLFTSLWQKGMFSKRTHSKDRYYDCDLKEWKNSDGERNVTVPMEEKLQENSNEEGTISYSRYIGIDEADFKEFVRNPQKGATFTGGSVHFYKDYSSERETRTIITLSLGQ